MNDFRIRLLVYDVVSDLFSEELPLTEFVVICVLVYKNIKNMILSGVIEGTNGVYNAIVKQTSLVGNEVYSDLTRNLSLDDIENYMNENNISNFKLMTNRQINDIVTLFKNRIEYRSFDTRYFDGSMYKVPNYLCNTITMKLLRKVHDKIMIPIIKYYKQNYDGIIDGSMEIISAIGGKYPGKVILFNIGDIPAETIANDIFMKRINVPYANISDFGGVVEITTNI
jgi:hypothetical protein